MKLSNLLKKKTITQSSETNLGILINDSFKGKPIERPLTWYEKMAYVNRAIEKRSEKVSEINFILRDSKGQEITEHEILDLLAKPNPNQTGEQFFKLWQEYKDIYGEVFVLKITEREFLEPSKKLSLVLLDPNKAKPEYDTYGNFVSVEYNGVSGKYSKDEIIYDSRQNPANPKRGVSLLKAGTTLIETAMEFENQNYKTIRSGGKVEGVISIDSEVITEENQKEFFKSYKEQLAELPENGGAILLGGNAKYQDIAKTMKELGYIESKKISLQDICILCDVPKVLLNAMDDVKFDNADTSIRMFLRDTIRPLMRQITTKLNENYDIVPEELELVFVDPTPNDLDAVLKKNDSGAKYKYMTINELRANLDLEPIEGGDELPKEPTFDFGLDEEEPEEKPEEEESKKKDFIHPLKSKEFRLKYHQKKIDEMDRGERAFLKVFKAYIKGQQKRLLEGIVGNKKKDLLGSAFNLNTEITIGKLMLMPVLRDYMERAGNDAKELVASKYRFIWTNELDTALNERVDFFIKEINQTTFNKLKDEFANSTEEGEGRQDLVKRIEGVYGDISKGRANTIARTEIHNTVNRGSLEGYKQAGMNIKIWVAVMDDRTRDEHAEMDGEERPINMPFSNGEMYPSSINCRCSI